MMKPTYSATLIAVISISITCLQTSFAEGPGLLDPPAPVYPDPEEIPPLPTLEANEEKLGYSLLELINPTALVPGQTVAEVKDEMVRLNQIVFEPAVDDGTPYGDVNTDLIHVWVRFEPLVAPDTPGTVAGGLFFTWEENAEWNVLAGWLEIDQLANVAALPLVSSITALDPPRHRSYGGEGDTLMNGPTARSGWAVDGSVAGGTNVKVGVISNGVTNLSTAQTSGDLPTVGTTYLGSGSGDEGTAMLEIVHEIAPGADLYFAPSGGTMQAHLNAVNALVTQGCNIITDDVGWYQEPYFESGFLGPSFAAMKASNPQLMFVSAAGNDAETHHQKTYTDAVWPFGYHDDLLYVDMPQGSSVDVYLQWDEAHHQVAVGNYDLYIHDNADGSVIRQSVGPGRPLETINYTNYGGHKTVYIRVAGANPTGATLEIFMDPKNGATQYVTNTSPVDAIFGHPVDPQVQAVTAVDYSTPTVVQWFASGGPWTQLSNVVTYGKPDLTGPDTVTWSGAGGSHLPSWLNTTLPLPPPGVFMGTSAAAPHVAGVAALIWSRDMNLSAAAVESALAMGCTNLGSNSTFGNGLVEAVQSMIYEYGPVPPTTVTATDGTVGPHVNITWSPVLGTLGADAYNIYANTIPDAASAVMISPYPQTANSYADVEYPTGFATRDQTMYYWIEPVYSGFGMKRGEWSAMESGYLQPTNLPPGLTVPTGTYQAATRVEVWIGGISVSDPDAGAAPIRLILSATMGDMNILYGPGLLDPSQVAGDGTSVVTITAPISDINAGLSLSESILYTSHSGVTGPETVTCQVDDLGNTGWGGSQTFSLPINLNILSTRFELWQHEQFPADVTDPTKQATVWGDNADPDSDFYSNSWEFFMNTDPKTTTPFGQMSWYVAGGNFHLVARVGNKIDPSAWWVEKSTTLGPASWTTASPSLSAVPHPDAPADAGKWDMSLPVGTTDMFYRIAFDTGFVEP